MARKRSAEQLDASLREHLASRTDRTPTPRGCLLWTGRLNTNGYGILKFRREQCLAHRMAYYVAFGLMLPPSVLLRHTCDTPRCVNPEHLIPGTVKENAMDCARSGSYARRLTAEKVMEIVALADAGVSVKELAARFEVAHGTVSNILAGRIWNWLTHRADESVAA